MTASEPKKWPQDAVIYHIYPMSFKDANNDGIGDLKGIIEKLDYLKDLGVNTIWVSPVYKTPMVDFGYDVSDYYDIDPAFGDLETFDELIKDAHKKGIKVLTDFVPNHTSNQHPWFLESRSSRNNPKRDWYVWKEPSGKHGKEAPPNNWLSVFGSSAWSFDKHTGQYYLHSYFKEQPDLNWTNPEVRKEMANVMEFWLKQGVDGFRIDAVDHLMEAKSFKDDPKNPNYISGKDDPYNVYLHINSQKRKERFKVISLFCGIADKYKERFLLSETYTDLKDFKNFYRVCANNLHAPLNLNLIGLEWGAGSYKKFVDKLEEIAGKNQLPNYILGNHDRPRVASRLGQDKARTLAFLIFTLRGTPFIYYGEEIGMENADIPANKIMDRLEKRIPGFGLGRDPQRSPMQWSAEKHAGFSKVKPWLPVSKKYKKLNVEKEQKDNSSMLNLYKKLIGIRRKSKALAFGSYCPIDLHGGGCVLAFMRKFGRETILVLINFSENKKDVSFGSEILSDFSGEGTIICNSFCDKISDKISLSKISFRPNEGYIIKLKNK